MKTQLLAVLAVLVSLVSAPAVAADTAMKEWTLIIFINGNNDLAPYSISDINEMEKVGSSSDVNVVVQWAHYNVKATKRLLVTKDNNPNKVTSPVVMELPRLDMGSPEVLKDFINWSVQNYPAKRYMVEIWNHGLGWHGIEWWKKSLEPDISLDDYTNNTIDTLELADALRTAAQWMGHPVDLYASDACSMASLEVATEIADSTQYMLGSEEVEELDGWEYAGALAQLVQNPQASAVDLGRMISEAYFAANPDNSDIGGMTLSVVDLSKVDAINLALGDVAQKVLASHPSNLQSVWKAAKLTQTFDDTPDYRDVGDFFQKLEVTLNNANIPGVDINTIKGLQQLLVQAVPYNRATSNYKAHGLTIWLPPWKHTFEYFEAEYARLRFTQTTGWNKLLASVVTDFIFSPTR